MPLPEQPPRHPRSSQKRPVHVSSTHSHTASSVQLPPFAQGWAVQLLAGSETFHAASERARHATPSHVADAAGGDCRISGSASIQPIATPLSVTSRRHQSSSLEAAIVSSIGGSAGVWIVRHVDGNGGRRPAAKRWAPRRASSGSRVPASRPVHVHSRSACMGARASSRHVKASCTRWQSLRW